eukprot:TRINITY_DN31315_c0_g1_i1.p1 TRINITY_DN31315_c0_g1~~TRINITY_DN31315_c0_g1_i1.p1  ORF type:complete len:201 (+),score=23.56 TRINITY_DN31315_c0_g1_i1:56-604(+)
MKKPSARLIFISLHWLHFDRCHSWCRRCNSPEKMKMFREAGHLAASCANVSYLDVSQLSKDQLRTYEISIDGIHFFKEWSDIEADVLLNTVCRDPPLMTMPPLRCDLEKEQMVKKRWYRSPAATIGCDGKTRKQLRRTRKIAKLKQQHMARKRAFRQLQREQHLQTSSDSADDDSSGDSQLM